MRTRLLEISTPDAFDLVYGLLQALELGDRPQLMMMESLPATLPAREPDGLIFKALFLTRLPDDIRSLVVTQAKTTDSRPLAAYLDQLWLARNSRRNGSTPILTR